MERDNSEIGTIVPLLRPDCVLYRRHEGRLLTHEMPKMPPN